MYQGKTVVFSKSDIPVYQKIKNNLQIQQCPNFMRSINLQAEIDPSIDSTNITNISFLTALSTQQFTNITNKNKYQCNIYGIKSSSVISEYIKNNSPQVFNYDHEDDSGEFQLICDYFKINFKNVTSIR
ncbi:hypothetical protein M9Y10_034876 [Tritrichomonas musculus]|uniref:Uncharacterized protein n=1 Tax=Tritrichomonas musculus TaxID=1915356 RepID=A0ABR2KH05_9EUKA